MDTGSLNKRIRTAFQFPRGGCPAVRTRRSVLTATRVSSTCGRSEKLITTKGETKQRADDGDAPIGVAIALIKGRL